LEVRPGEFVTIVGPNGAGKTTAVAHPCHVEPSDARAGLIAGMRCPKARITPAADRLVIASTAALWRSLRPKENLRFFGKMYDVPHLEARIIELLDKWT